MDINQIKSIAAQLRKPQGADSGEVVERMNENNRNVALKTIELLDLKGNVIGAQQVENILEIGPANGAYVPEIVEEGKIEYTGIDYSEDMVREANKRNARYVSTGKARFVHGSSDEMPFEDEYFKKAFSVNTFYFWDDPIRHLLEVKRVLTKGGRFNIGFGSRNFMKQLPFTEFGFNLYSPEEVGDHILNAGFTLERITPLEPEIIEIAGHSVKKEFYIAVCRKEI